MWIVSGMLMAADRDRFNKVLAVAINPGAYEREAIAALRKARDLVKTDPSLAHPPPPPPTPVMKGAPPDESLLQSRVTNITRFWLSIFLSNLSEQAYGLGLKSKLSCDFSVTPAAVNIRCDGSKKGCEAFQAHLDWLIGHINSQSKKAGAS
jgi:hypothetical protein